MIVYRCLTSDEIISMIHDIEYEKPVVKGSNTFNYEYDESYKHFFVFADHAYYFKNINGKYFPCIGQYIIPDELIREKGFGFYYNVKTMRNSDLYSNCIPLPEVIINNEFFNSNFLYKVESGLYDNFVTKRLDKDDNKKYNEPTEDYLKVNPNESNLLGYSYADVYYEMLYRLAINNDMDFDRVIKQIKDINLHEEIKDYFNNNIRYFDKQTKRFIKTLNN